MTEFESFYRQPYLNLETFRKNGAGVRTPVWFVQQDHTLYVRTLADSGKVKRVRKHGKANIAPCTMDGTPLSDWVAVQAREIKDEQIARQVDGLLGQKYGLIKKMIGLASFVRGTKYTILELKGRDLQ